MSDFCTFFTYWICGVLPSPSSSLPLSTFVASSFNTFVASSFNAILRGASPCKPWAARRPAWSPPIASTGFLTRVPLLAPVPLPAQVEILADVWVRHRALATRRANLLDFAVLQAASATAEALVRVGGFVLRTLLQECVPWDIGAYRLDAVTADRIAELPTWGDWPEEDAFGWHSAADLADQPHRLAAPLLAAANRTEASPAIERHLAGQALSSASYTIYKVDVQWYHYPKRLLHTDALRRAARTRFAGLTCHAEDVGAGAEASRHAGWCAPRWVTRL